MGRVHPDAVALAPEPAAATSTSSRSAAAEEDQSAVVLTVWRKSLLFGCDGFTVFDARGDLAFRVDCYASPRRRRRAEVVLMGAAGEPLLTVRRARALGLGLLSSSSERWVIYDGDGSKPLLSVRRHAAGLGGASMASKAVAHVTSPLAASSNGAGAEAAAYVVEGSYAKRACAVRDARGVLAEVRRKEAVGDDVFRLVASPRLGAPLAMGLVIALDEMFAGRRPSALALLRRTWSAYE